MSARDICCKTSFLGSFLVIVEVSKCASPAVPRQGECKWACMRPSGCRISLVHVKKYL
jgi:hypothetical protein